MCHIVRRDNLLALMQMLVSAVFWFHPLVWWIGARLVDERERACDERVLAPGRRPGNLRRKHFGDVPALYRIAGRQCCGRDRRRSEAAHRSHHEKRAGAPAGFSAKGRAARCGAGASASADGCGCFRLSASAK